MRFFVADVFFANVVHNYVCVFFHSQTSRPRTDVDGLHVAADWRRETGSLRGDAQSTCLYGLVILDHIYQISYDKSYMPYLVYIYLYFQIWCQQGGNEVSQMI